MFENGSSSPLPLPVRVSHRIPGGPEPRNTTGDHAARADRGGDWAGMLLSWRWTDAAQEHWQGLVQFYADGLGYLQWVDGVFLTRDIDTTHDDAGSGDRPAGEGSEQHTPTPDDGGLEVQ